MPGRRKKWRAISAAHARDAKARKASSKPTESVSSPDPIEIEVVDLQSDEEQEAEATTWPGGVENHELWGSDSEYSSTEEDLPTEDGELIMDSSEDEFSELEGKELVESLQRRQEHEAELVEEVTGYGKVASSRLTGTEWRKAESSRKLGYNGLSARTKRFHAQKAREKEKVDAEMRKS